MKAGRYPLCRYPLIAAEVIPEYRQRENLN